MGLVSIWARGSIGTTKPSFCSDLTCRKLCPKEYYSPPGTVFSSSFFSLESSPASIVLTCQSTAPVFLPTSSSSRPLNPPLSPYLRLSNNFSHNTWMFLSIDERFILSVRHDHFFFGGPNMVGALSASVHCQMKDCLRAILNVFPGFRFLEFINTHDWFCFYEFLPTYSNIPISNTVATWGWQETKCLSSRDFLNFLFSWQAR